MNKDIDTLNNLLRLTLDDEAEWTQSTDVQ